MDARNWEAQTARGLPRRDLWLLPLIALLTVLALSAAARDSSVEVRPVVSA